MIVSVVKDGRVLFYEADGGNLEQFAEVRVGDDVAPAKVAILGAELSTFLGLEVAPERVPAPRPVPALNPGPAHGRFKDAGEESVLRALRERPGLGAHDLAVFMFGTAANRIVIQAALGRLKRKGAIVPSAQGGGYLAVTRAGG